MKANARALDWNNVPAEVKPFLSEGQTQLTPGRTYEVHGVSVYLKLTFYLVIDDLGIPVFLPSWTFSLQSRDVPHNWICSVDLGQGLDLVLGPPCIAADLGSYGALIDREPDKFDELFEFIEGEGDGTVA